MIASVRGEVLDIALDHVVIEAAGVGYKLMAAPSTLATLRRGSEARLITAMIVREDSQTLYGFASPAERDFFRLMIENVTGVGPKMALTIMSRLSLPSLESAIRMGDITTLAKTQGIGKKTAERLVVELKSKLGGGDSTGVPTSRVSLLLQSGQCA